MSIQPPALRPLHHGWSAERQQQFIDHLAMHGSVSGAARAVGMTRQSAYWLRRQIHAQDFAQAWDAALADRDRWVEDLAMDRLLDGEEEVIERDGETVAVRRRPCDIRLLLFHMKRLERQAAQADKLRNWYESSKVSKLREEMRALVEEAQGDAEDHLGC